MFGRPSTTCYSNGDTTLPKPASKPGQPTANSHTSPRRQLGGCRVGDLRVCASSGLRRIRVRRQGVSQGSAGTRASRGVRVRRWWAGGRLGSLACEAEKHPHEPARGLKARTQANLEPSCLYTKSSNTNMLDDDDWHLRLLVAARNTGGVFRDCPSKFSNQRKAGGKEISWQQGMRNTR